VLRIDGIVGWAGDPLIAGRLHDLGHQGRVETLVLERRDTLRHRLRATTDRGTACAIALARDQRLGDGAVLVLDDARAIVVRMADEVWLRLAPQDADAALELGYHAGNLHWRVRFDGADLLVAQEGPAALYLDRVAPLLATGRVRHVADSR
jgi:urease accessory protein